MKKRQAAVGMTECWEHDLLDKHGYGRLRQGTVEMLAHRASYRLFHGPIPHSYEIDHLCCNPACWNPDHLEAVPRKENARRARMRRPTYSCGHPRTGENSKAKNKGGGRRVDVCRECENGRMKDKSRQRRELQRSGFSS